MTRNRLLFVESLRLLAAALVFSQHVIERYPGNRWADAWLGLGPGLLGVMIFFLVSGYVVPLSVGEDFRFGRFMARRVFRIYPLVLAVYALVLLLGQVGLVARWAFMGQAGAFDWAANLLLVQDYVGASPFLGVTWTLAVEFAWYALFALAYARWGDRAGLVLARAVPLALIAVAGLSLAIGARIPPGRPGMIYACVLGYLACLHDRKAITGADLARHVLAFVAVNGLTGAVGFGWFHHARISLAQELMAMTCGPLVFFAVVLCPRLRASPLLDRGILPTVGAASFSVYLLHPVAIAAAGEHAPGPVSAAASAAALTALLAFAGYRWVERPGIALGRRMTGTAMGGRPSAAALAGA